MYKKSNKDTYNKERKNIYSGSGDIVGIQDDLGGVYGKEVYDVESSYGGLGDRTVAIPELMSPLDTPGNLYNQQTFNKELDVQKSDGLTRGLLDYLQGVFAPRTLASGEDAKFRTAYSADEGRMYQASPEYLGISRSTNNWSKPGGIYNLDVTRRGSEGYDYLYGAAKVNPGLKGLLQRILPGGETGYGVQDTDLGSGMMYHDDFEGGMVGNYGYADGREMNIIDKHKAVNEYLHQEGKLLEAPGKSYDEYHIDSFKPEGYDQISSGNTYGNSAAHGYKEKRGY